MATVTDSYSRLVAWLKIILPLLALAILSTLFLVSRTIDPSQTIPYADVDVAELARTQRIGAPSYSGMTEDGSAVSFTAESARPEGGFDGQVTALKPVARIEMKNGRVVELTSDEGYVDQKTQVAGLSGNVRLQTSDGYEVTTEQALTRLDATSVETTGPVVGTSPMGDVRAGRAVLTKAADGGFVLRFEGRVNLLYRPQS